MEHKAATDKCSDLRAIILDLSVLVTNHDDVREIVSPLWLGETLLTAVNYMAAELRGMGSHLTDQVSGSSSIFPRDSFALSQAGCRCGDSGGVSSATLLS